MQAEGPLLSAYSLLNFKNVILASRNGGIMKLKVVSVGGVLSEGITATSGSEKRV
jgi:hypothetical protein